MHFPARGLRDGDLVVTTKVRMSGIWKFPVWWISRSGMRNLYHGQTALLSFPLFSFAYNHVSLAMLLVYRAQESSKESDCYVDHIKSILCNHGLHLFGITVYIDHH